jgi:hypothetical protein
MGLKGGGNMEVAQVFNNAIECGLRAIAILSAAYPKAFDVNRIAQYDYLLVHSGDVDGGPDSIHPPTPHRSGELSVRRSLVEQGMIVSKSFTSDGILYSAGEYSVVFLQSLRSEYTALLKSRADWVVKTFAELEDDDLTRFLENSSKKWGSEFQFEALIRAGQ